MLIYDLIAELPEAGPVRRAGSTSSPQVRLLPSAGSGLCRATQGVGGLRRKLDSFLIYDFGFDGQRDIAFKPEAAIRDVRFHAITP